jgi:DNA polymerase-4
MEQDVSNVSTQPIRKIIHLDMDAFYAAIEQRDHPELRGKPVIVGGQPDKRGVVATCSYEARRFGIHSAMPSLTAFKRCPQAIFLPPRFDVYRSVSRQIIQIFHAYTDLVEPLALDEAYLDVTENKLHLTSATLIARQIKQQIQQQTGLTASAGVSFNKFLAKLASDFQKPDGFTVVTPQQASQFLDATPIRKFFGVGKVTEARLNKLGIQTGADLKQVSEEQLRTLFGERGSMLYNYVRGQDHRQVLPTRTRKSVSKEITLQTDSADHEHMVNILQHLSEQVEKHLIELGIAGKTITLKLKWSDFQLITRSTTIPTAIQDAHTIMQHLLVLLTQLKSEQKPVRLLGVSLSNFVPEHAISPQQVYTSRSLWDTDLDTLS